MNAFAGVRKVGFDTETTSADPDEARIVTAALVVRGGSRPDQDFTWLIDPGVPIPDEAAGIHGITTEIAKAKGQQPRVALEDLASKLAAALRAHMPVIAYNLGFDWTVLDRDLARHGLASMTERLAPLAPITLLDPHIIDKELDKYRRGSRKLQPTCELYGVTLTDWHTAEADALAALLLTEKLFERYPRLAQMTPAAVFNAQQEWRRTWAEQFQDYLRSDKAGEKRDPAAVIDGSWPLRPRQAVATSGVALPP
ncbi:exonuclease domain-containing protein [Kitasatospora kifunensis]|uniref:DNA polymerase-3 subunit epsilon n=1 Tax=Kitasatospora kifunensis TaxID=58351 RepID=A0A7W7QYV9_KITKI|nr:exonuclease domain-containing protein [Kitasatospora kifunensis]MBB4922145.1 DNA polymerase-3 subunit epsilon [Kitasatospora kifunensis]